MNPASQTGQTALGQPNGQQPQRMFKPHEMDSLPLSDAEKLKYKEGLTRLWNTVQNSPQASQQQQEASRKIADFSAQLMSKIRSNMQRPPSQASSMGAMPASQGASTTQAGPDQGMAASAGSPPASAGGQPGAAPATVGAAANVPGQQPQQGNRPLGPGISPQLRQHAAEVVAYAPQDIVDQGPEAVVQWLNTRRDKYGASMMRAQQMTGVIRENGAKLRGLQQKGTLTPDEKRVLNELSTRLTQAQQHQGQAKSIADSIRKEQAAIKEARGLSNGAAPDVPVNQAVRPGQQPGSNANAAQPNSAVEGPKGQPAGVAGRMSGANAQAGQQPPQPTQAPQPSPVTASQAAPAQQIKIEPGMSQVQVPPPVNTGIATAAAAAGMPSAGTPTQNTARMPPTPIQTATPTAGAPPSLNHSAALNLANQNRASQQPAGIANQTQLQGTPQGAGGTPSSAGVMGSTAQQAGHPHAHPGQQQPQTTLANKMSIPRQLPESATRPPQPVSLSIGGVTPGRPTYTGGGGTAGGVMGQPILPKIPQVQMEGEGERVLNRKKLDDLVRQVCGGQSEGQEGNALTPDVEEVRYSFPQSIQAALETEAPPPSRPSLRKLQLTVDF